MKSGANFLDQNRIKELAAAGATAEEIAQSLKLPLPCVQSFMPNAEGGATQPDGNQDGGGAPSGKDGAGAAAGDGHRDPPPADPPPVNEPAPAATTGKKAASK